MKTLESFLEFLIEALSWVHYHEEESTRCQVSDGPHFLLITLIEDLIQPWLKAEDNPIKALSKGMYSLIHLDIITIKSTVSQLWLHTQSIYHAYPYQKVA